MDIIQGDALTELQKLPDESVHCCVTSPPYYGLRDYGFDGQIGLEKTPGEYVIRLVEVFREVKRVLRNDGTLWLNLGDSYANPGNARNGAGEDRSTRSEKFNGGTVYLLNQRRTVGDFPGLKPKDLIGIPWRVAFALQADGWFLRSDIIWHKPNPMPESVRDRCTKAHEYVFMLTKSRRYFYDYEAGKESASGPGKPCGPKNYAGRTDCNRCQIVRGDGLTRNRRDVWTIATKPYKGAHFATMPPDLVKVCIKAGCPEGGTVLDPFAGSGTTGAVAKSLGRDYILIEANPDYIGLIEERIGGVEAPPVTLEAFAEVANGL